MQSFQAPLLSIYASASSIANSVYPRNLVNAALRKSTFDSNYLPLHGTPIAYTITADPDEPDVSVNIFNSEGIKVYEIRRPNPQSIQWKMTSSPDNVDIASIECSITKRSIDYHNKPNCGHRDIGKRHAHRLGIPGRTFFLHDGANYTWDRSTKYLERIVKPVGDANEVRKRLALVLHSRANAFDWKILIDPDFDAEIAITTAFISMLTAWPVHQPVSPGSVLPNV